MSLLEINYEDQIEVEGVLYEVSHLGVVYQIIWPFNKDESVWGRRFGIRHWGRLFAKSDYQNWQHAMRECVGGVITYGMYQELQESCKVYLTREYKVKND